MKQFFKYTLASMLGTFLTGVLLFIIGGVIVGGMIAGAIASLDFGKDDKKEIEDSSVLEIRLDRPIVDRGGKRRYEFNGPGDFSSFQELGLNNILNALENARYDERIERVHLELDNVVGGMATMKEIRDAIRTLRDSTDKPILAYGKAYDQRTYYLASAADEVHLYPEGQMEFKGLASELAFFKGMLDKLNVEMQVVRGPNNTYKSAVEPFTREGMSKESRRQMKDYLADLWDVYLEDISNSRGIEREALERIADSLLIRKASDAVEHGLVDELLYPDEFEKRTRDSLELDEDEELPTVALNDYVDSEVPDEHWSGEPREDEEAEGAEEGEKEEGKVGVIYAMGGIQSGNSGNEVMGAKTISESIEKAREDSSIKAIVMRVNSPGGSALASDRIWREVDLTLDEKPFIVSMGDVAASGGYYISCAADRIFAEPNTITGSIGVFGLIPYTGEMFEEHLGIDFERVKTNEHSDFLLTSNRRLDQKERMVLQEQVDEVYQTFLKRVSDGRDMSKERVDSLARGRVWSGVDAERIGLVDEMGGLEASIAYAADEAGLEDPKRVAYPERKDPFEKLMKDFTGDMRKKVLDATLGKDMRYYRKYRYLRSVLEMKGVQARMPYHIEVR